MKRNILGQRKDYWGPLEALEQVAPDSSEIVKSVQNLPNIRYMYQCCMRTFSINIEVQGIKVQAQWVTSLRDRSLWHTALSLLLPKKMQICHVTEVYQLLAYWVMTLSSRMKCALPFLKKPRIVWNGPRYGFLYSIYPCKFKSTVLAPRPLYRRSFSTDIKFW